MGKHLRQSLFFNKARPQASEHLRATASIFINEVVTIKCDLQRLEERGVLQLSLPLQGNK